MEYEYSLTVKSIDDYIDFCEKNNYKLIKKVKQTRIIYRNSDNKTNGRITIEEDNGNTKMILDFKEDNLSSGDLHIRKESAPISFDSLSNAEDILAFLGYKKDNSLIRERKIYKKNKVTFEIDIYEHPAKSYVVAVEGDKKQVDKVYEQLSDINNRNSI